MTDFLDRLSRRLDRKQSEDPLARRAPATPDPPAATEPHPQDKPRAADRPAVLPWSEGDVAAVFAPDGPIARLLGAGYHPRPGQVAMARLVQRALDQQKHALIEAGTGSGKSFAYLVPLIRSGSRAFLSTANKTLQNQLWHKDIPDLQRIAGNGASPPFTAALLKGRGNYVCAVKLKEAGRQMRFSGQGPSVVDVLARLEEVPSGDVEELGLVGPLRDELTVGRHECLGARCPQLKRCYYERARVRAEGSDLVVLNHALLAQNVVLEGRIVEPRPIVVVDEAHELESYVIGALRVSLAYDQVPAFVADPGVAGTVGPRVRGLAVQANHDLFVQLAARFDGDREQALRREAPAALPKAQTLSGHIDAIRTALNRRFPPTPPGAAVQDPQEAYAYMVVDRATRLAGEVEALGKEATADVVRYCEREGERVDARRIVLCQEPVEVGDFLREHFWQQAESVVCTSATLTVRRTFDHLARRTGAPLQKAICQVIDSPFDYATQALLYTPPGLYPAYDEEEAPYLRQLAAEVERLVHASRGRAFVLCTSTRRVGQLYDMLHPRLPYTCYQQGMAPRHQLLEQFRTHPEGAVLFATRSFWAGVDIPGQALSLVIIDKLPFAPYLDPVVSHRSKRIQRAGGKPFPDYLLPEAVLALKQGVGRLIRRETDRGVMAILDSRLLTQRYGSQIIASLPRARRTARFEDVVAFFEQE
jgi:ATP-dependent DNA helicase DinG